MRRPSGARFYNDVSLRGPVPDRLLVRLPRLSGPAPALAARLVPIAAAAASGIFDPEGDAFAYAQGFGWLGALADLPEGRHVAGALFDAWLAAHGRYAPRAWAPGLAARRTRMMLTHADLLLEGRDAPHREEVFGTLARQVRHLGRAVRKSQGGDRLEVAANLMTGALALPGASEQERAAKSALSASLSAFAGGALPDGLRDLQATQDLTASLLALQAAFEGRGLTAPADLREALSILRLYLGAMCLPGADALAVMPGGTAGDPVLLRRARPLRLEEAAPLLERYGYAALRAGRTAVHADLLGRASGAFCLSDDAERVVTAAGGRGRGLEALSSRSEAWTEALASPAAAATLDAPGYGDARATVETAEEGHVLTMERRGPDGMHLRRLFLSAEGDALIGEDQAPREGATYRFPLPPGVETRTHEQGRIALVLPSGRLWRIETASARLAVEEGVYAGGGAPLPSRQVVLTAAREGVRWAIRRA